MTDNDAGDGISRAKYFHLFRYIITIFLIMINLLFTLKTMPMAIPVWKLSLKWWIQFGTDYVNRWHWLYNQYTLMLWLYKCLQTSCLWFALRPASLSQQRNFPNMKPLKCEIYWKRNLRVTFLMMARVYWCNRMNMNFEMSTNIWRETKDHPGACDP